ncbi:ABC transporter substrate-binding protein [Streptomyces phaeochromogenes]|uniref:ABC transporter substrate-binding protein n=1 Tax=Streptomyces phaeochromogenes TaxID=1923 RepID=UPI002DD99563|nr:ABC transporter substrate-binding protein [Streptomyces phaeochromogenes]WRZ34682.1 ABC transporter substrate-binding protein [Streptomyces phaeochromogenes]
MTTAAAKGDVDTLHWDLPSGEPTSLDYAHSGDYSSNVVVANLCDTLVRMKADLSYAPGLATSWSNPNPTTLVYKIRNGVKFWDGSPLTAADVAYSLNRNLDEKVASNNFPNFVNVTSIKATGPLEVTVRFRQPDELFNKEMAATSGVIAKADFIKEKGTSYGKGANGVMCTGPFELAGWKANTSIQLVRNDAYWDKAFRARAAKVDVSFVSDTTNLTLGLKSGQLDGAFGVPAAAIPALGDTSTGAIHQGSGLGSYQLAPNGTAAGKDEHIRLALLKVIDRKALATAVFHNSASPLYTFVPPSGWDAEAKQTFQKAYDKLDKPGPGGDPDAAKQELAKSPLKDGTVTIGVQAGNATEVTTVTLIQEQARKIGLKVQIKQLQPLQFSTAFYDPKARAGIDFLLTKGFLSVADPLDYLALGPVPDGQFNWIGWNDTRTAELIAKARQTTDATRRADYIVQAQARYEAVAWSVPLLSINEVTYLNKRVTGAPLTTAAIFQPSLAVIGSAK